MVIAAKTGQGKTLCFGIPILDMLIKRLTNEDVEFKSLKALVMSPTRELALQITEHIKAIVPVQHEAKIKICPIVGGMSIQKQERLLSYEPTIIISTPGRLWELLNERNNTYLTNELPLIDVLVLDEADRMIEDGHFKEMKLILDYIYTKRVEFKKQVLTGKKQKQQLLDQIPVEEANPKRMYKEDVLKMSKG
jgi:ATP-dependent RNA helicase DDX24/MAK5